MRKQFDEERLNMANLKIEDIKNTVIVQKSPGNFWI
jgi:hypothetical protein